MSKNIDLDLTFFNEEERSGIANTFRTLGERYSLTPENGSQLDSFTDRLRTFSFTKEYGDIIMKNVVRAEKGKVRFHVLNCKIEYSYYTGKVRSISPSTSMDARIFGLAKLKSDPGHIYIRQETFRDKIRELIYPIEVDFEEHPSFSSNYFVLTDNETAARSFLTPGLMDYINTLGETTIEVVDGYLMVANEKKVDAADAVQMVGLCELVQL